MHKEKATNNVIPGGSVERIPLIIATVINLLFVTAVTIATDGSLFFYTLLHITVSVSALAVLFTGNVSLALKRLTLIASILAALLAVALVYSYLPGYLSYVKGLN